MIRNDRPNNVTSLSCMSSNVLTKMYFQNGMERNCGCCYQYEDCWPRSGLQDHSEKMFWEKYAKENSCQIKRHGDFNEESLGNPYVMNSCQRIRPQDYTEREYLGRMKGHPSQRNMIENYLDSLHFEDKYVKEDHCHINRFEDYTKKAFLEDPYLKTCPCQNRRPEDYTGKAYFVDQRFEDYTEKAFLEDQYLKACPCQNRIPEDYTGKAYFVDQYMKPDPYQRMLEDYTEKAFLKENRLKPDHCQRQRFECMEKSMLGQYMVEDPFQRRKFENDAANSLLKVQFVNEDLYRKSSRADFGKLNKMNNFHSKPDFFTSEKISNFNETLEEKSKFLEKCQVEKYQNVNEEIDKTFDLLSSNVKLIFENEVKPLEDLLKASLIRLAYLEWENKILKKNVLPLNI